MVKKEDDPPGEEAVPLDRLLRIADLSRYEDKLRNVLKLRHAGDLQYVDETDLNGIGMSRPEQKRLRKEYVKMFPKNGLVGKLKKVFVRGEPIERREIGREANTEQHVIPIEKITLCKELGKGEFGAVFQASWNNGPAVQDTLQVAVKCVPTDKLMNCTTSFLSEAAIMTRMRHDNVVRLYGVVLDTKKVMLVSELATCGSLLECLHKPALRDSFPVEVLCDYASQIACGMAYLESQRLIHRDLAARNVLVFGPKKVKISDFGLSRSLGVGEDYYRSEFSPTLKLPIAWCAPESINFLKFTSASDVWSFGVTLWEMFTYGKMPWNGCNGGQILEAVDRQKRQLDRPECCPDDMWDLIRECWSHAAEKRPTFKQIVDGFPDRLPQTVRAIRECTDMADDHLQFKKDDLITVLCRTPASYPDGYYWLGSLRNGKSGLFRPTDTVAHLGAEGPSAFRGLTTTCVGSNGSGKEVKDKKKEWKESDRDKKKLLISEPQGDLRHMCHVGIDGTAIGLLQIDKKDLSKGTPVPSAISPGSRRSITPSVTSTSVVAASDRSISIDQSPMGSRMASPATVARHDKVTFRDRHSLISPPISRAPSHPPNGSIHNTHSINSFPVNGGSPSPVGTIHRTSLEPSAPPLSAPNSMTRAESAQVAELLDESINALNGSIGSLEGALHSIASFGSDEFLQPRRISNQQQPISAVYARTPHNAAASQPSTSDSILMDEVAHLDRDLTDFSLSSLGGSDYSDTAPLIKASNGSLDIKRRSGSENIHSCSSSPPTVRLMNDEELTRWHEKQQKQHKKVDKKLEEAIRRESEEREEERRQMVSQQPNPPDWSPEAQQAYRLLVECGDRLQTETIEAANTSPRPLAKRQSAPISGSTRSGSTTNGSGASANTNGSATVQTHVKATIATTHSGSTFIARPALPPKSYTNPDAIKPPELPPKKFAKPAPLSAPETGYDNLNGIGTAAEEKSKIPPPVPPKPKVRLVAKNFA